MIEPLSEGVGDRVKRDYSPNMKRARALLVAIAPLIVVACEDQEKKKAELIAKTAPSAEPKAATTEVPTTAPAASSAALAVKPKKECGEGPEVTVDDPDLAAAIRVKLDKKTDAGAGPGTFTTKELASITSLNVTNKASLDELDPCVFPKLVNLRFLYLPKGSYRDLSPIANLTKLEALRASISEVEDLRPLEKLVMLDQLDLGRTHVRDISVLANLVNLTELALDDTQVSDISPLAKLTKLEQLSIKNTLVQDVSPLRDLKKLRLLNVSGTALTNLDVLEPLRARGLRIQTK